MATALLLLLALGARTAAAVTDACGLKNLTCTRVCDVNKFDCIRRNPEDDLAVDPTTGYWTDCKCILNGTFWLALGSCLLVFGVAFILAITCVLSKKCPYYRRRPGVLRTVATLFMAGATTAVVVAAAVRDLPAVATAVPIGFMGIILMAVDCTRVHYSWARDYDD